MIIKKYFIWQVVKENDHFYSHPNTFSTRKTKWASTIDVEETALTDGKGSYVGILIVDDTKATILNEVSITDASKIIAKTVVTDSKLTKSAVTIDYEKDYLNHDYKYLEATEVVKLLNSWYPVTSDNKDDKVVAYFSLSKDGFTLIDSRPIDDDLVNPIKELEETKIASTK